MNKRNSRLLLLLTLALVALLVGVTAPDNVQAVGRSDLNRALLATVRVAVPIDGEQDSYSTGSGTILSADGYILTNFHVMGDTERQTLYNRKGTAFIAINPTNLRGLPTWLYEAELVRGDPVLDLVLLKITGYLESNDPLPASLGLVTMELADSDAVQIGDELSVIGFPGIGGDTVTFTQGKVSGFLDEDRNDVFEWIKTDAEVNHGNSGGLAIDENGQMIGVPTAGVSDVEAAGKISLIRPVNLALPILRAGAGFGGATSTEAGGVCSNVEQHPSGAGVSNLVFAEAVDRRGDPSGVSSSFEGNLNTVYALFDYDGFRNGKEFRYTWYLDGDEAFEDTVKWSGGSRGSEWVNIYSESGLPDGSYRLEIRYDKVLLSCDVFSMGQAPAPSKLGSGPVLSPITFAGGERNDSPVDAGVQFDSGTEEIYAFFDYSAMSDGMDWRQIWYVDGEVGLDSSKTWSAGEEGNYWISVNADGGLPDGDYVLELYVEGELAQAGEFSIGGGSAPPSKLLPTQEGVVVIGTVVDANRRSRAIADAMIIFLAPGVDLDGWTQTQDMDQVASAGVSDSSGQFQLSDPLIPGTTYPVIVVADGYRPVLEEGYTLPADAESPFELDITMVRE